MSTKEVIKKLKAYSNPKSKEGMTRFGINTEYALGTNLYDIRKIAKHIKKIINWPVES